MRNESSIFNPKNLLFCFAYIGAVDIFKTSADLVYKVLEVSVCQRLARTDDLVEISFHQLLDQVAANIG